MAVLWDHEWQLNLQCEIMGSTNSKAYKREMAILWVNLQPKKRYDQERRILRIRLFILLECYLLNAAWNVVDLRRKSRGFLNTQKGLSHITSRLVLRSSKGPPGNANAV